MNQPTTRPFDTIHHRRSGGWTLTQNRRVVRLHSRGGWSSVLWRSVRVSRKRKKSSIGGFEWIAVDRIAAVMICSMMRIRECNRPFSWRRRRDVCSRLPRRSWRRTRVFSPLAGGSRIGESSTPTKWVQATSSASCVFWCLLIETFQGRTSSSTGRYFHLDFVTFVGDCQETPDWWMLGGWLFCRLPLNGMSNKEHTEVIVICCDGLSLAVGLLWFLITHSVNGWWWWCWWVNCCQLGRDLFWEMYFQIIQG